MIRYYIFLFGILSFVSALAEDFDCKDSGSTICEAMRLDQEYKCADKDLNDLYKVEINTIQSVKKKRLLIEAERAWIKYRDKLCKYEDFEGGAQGINLVRCLDRVTIQRINDFSDPNIDKDPWTCKK